MPPFEGMAVKVTFVQGQIVFPGYAEIATDGVTMGSTDMVTEVEAVPGQLEFGVTITLTVFPAPKVAEEKVGPFVPAFIPLTCHW